MALFEKPDLEKLKSEHKYARLIDWANYTKDPVLSREARRVVASDPEGLAEYIYETVYWTRRNSGHNGRRLPRRGIGLIRQASTMAAHIGEPLLEPLAGSLRVYEQFGDPDIKTRMLYYSVVFDIFLQMGDTARGTLEALARDRDEEISKQAKATLADLPEDEPEWDEWDDWEDEDEDEDDEQDDDDDAAEEDDDR